MEANTAFMRCFDRISNRLYKLTDSIAVKRHDFLRRIINNRFKPEEYIFAPYISEDYKGDRIHLNQTSLEDTYKIARDKLKRCKTLPACFETWDELEVFEGRDRSYAIFEHDTESGKLMELHVAAIYENSNEKISTLLRELNLPFFITRDLLPSQS